MAPNLNTLGYRQNAYKCRLIKQFKLLRAQVKKIKILFQEIYLRFIRAIDSTSYHPTSGRKKSSKGTQLKRSIHRDSSFVNKQLMALDQEDKQMLQDGEAMAEYLLGQIDHNKNSTNKGPAITEDGTIMIAPEHRIHPKNHSHRTKRFIIASAILGWKVYKNKQEINEL